MNVASSWAARALAAAGGTAALLALAAAPAAAHLELQPTAVPPGKSSTVSLKVKSELEKPTTSVEVLLPVEEAPDLVVKPGNVPGWRATTKKIAMPQSPARKAANHTKTSGVGSIVWTRQNADGGIQPQQTTEFPMTLENIPASADRLVFRAVQTYADGRVVRWFDVPGPAGAAVFQPAAILAVSNDGTTGAAGGHAGHGAGAPTPSPASTTAAAAQPDANANVNAAPAAGNDTLTLTSAPVWGGLGVVAGLLLGLLVGVLLGRRGRERSVHNA